MKRIVMATAMAMLLAGGTAFAEGGSESKQQGQGGSGSMGSSVDEPVGGSGAMGSESSDKSSKGGSGAMGAQRAAEQGMLTVKEVDKTNNKLTFEAQLAPNAKISSATGKTLSLDQIKEGDQVRANFDPKTGDVQKVTVQAEQQQKPSGQGGSGSQQPESESDSPSYEQ